MTVRLRWKPSFSTSCLHIADGLNRGLPVVEPRLVEQLGGPASRLRAAIEATGAPVGRMWRQLSGLAGMNESANHIAEVALVKTIGRVDHLESTSAMLATAIADMQSAVRIALPKLMEELALRERPLREQWEARGPGLLHQVGELTDGQLVPEEAEVLLIHPAFGGGGSAHLPFNSVRIEAVLANPHADLPEVVRLAWLLAQLQLDLPILSETIHADRLPHMARLAMLPAALRAAECVERVRFSPQLIEQALRAWQLAVPPSLDVAGLVSDWWETYQLDRPPFRVALAALDQMLS
jgi:hypothetical protein